MQHVTMQDKEYIVSIIVPVYNVEKYLDRCIGSIVNQTYCNLEILLVDDGSTDHSPSILKRWGEQDKRIRIITKQNGGLSDARNVGIEAATGDYYIFIDSDDTVNIHIVQHLLDLCKKNNSKLAICGYQKFDNDKQISIYDRKTVDEETVSIYPFERYIEQYQHSVEQWIKMVTAWGKMYKSELFETIRFPVGRLHEDEFTTYKLVDIAGTIAESNAHYYYYFQRCDSIMKNQNINMAIDFLDALQERSMLIRNKYPDLQYKSRFWIFNQIYTRYLRLMLNGHTDLGRIKEIYNSEYQIFHKEIRRKRIKYWMMYQYPKILTLLYKLKRLTKRTT